MACVSESLSTNELVYIESFEKNPTAKILHTLPTYSSVFVFIPNLVTIHNFQNFIPVNKHTFRRRARVSVTYTFSLIHSRCFLCITVFVLYTTNVKK